jgi:DNA invertase Pin-like site-specific DNA recombinase
VAFNQMLKDAVRRRFDVLMVWSGPSTGSAGAFCTSPARWREWMPPRVALYSDQQAIDSTSPFGKAMMQMACVFGELESEMFQARVAAGLNRVRERGLKKLGRPQVGKRIEETIRRHLGAGHGILKMAKLRRRWQWHGQRVKRVKREMELRLAEAA